MSGMQLLVTDWHGQYVPQHFVNSFVTEDWNISEEDAKHLAARPESECYWDVWNAVLDMAEHIDTDGNVWHLWQDGDLFAFCVDLMTDEEYKNFFGEDREAA